MTGHPLSKYKAPRGLPSAGAVVPTCEDKNMTSEAQTADAVEALNAFHYPWCDPTRCVADDSGVELVVDHHSAPVRPEIFGDKATIHAARTRAVWSETEGGLRVIVDVPPTTDLDTLAGYCSWISDALRDIREMTTPLPKFSICPDFCTAEADGDERVRRDHLWKYFGWSSGDAHYSRTHWGPVGKTYRTQYERTDANGYPQPGRMLAGRRIARTAVPA